jgi:hypothetical protein
MLSRNVMGNRRDNWSSSNSHLWIACPPTIWGPVFTPPPPPNYMFLKENTVGVHAVCWIRIKLLKCSSFVHSLSEPLLGPLWLVMVVGGTPLGNLIIKYVLCAHNDVAGTYWVGLMRDGNKVTGKWYVLWSSSKRLTLMCFAFKNQVLYFLVVFCG